MVFFRHGSEIFQKVNRWLGSNNQDISQEESQSLIERPEFELPTVSEPREELEEEITRFLSSPKYRGLLAAADDLIRTYAESIAPLRGSQNTETIWVSLLQYTGRFEKFMEELLHLHKTEFEMFQKSKKYQYIENSNNVIKTMIISLMRSHQPQDLSKLDVFLSHAGEQKPDIVEPLHGKLRNASFRCFYDAESMVVSDSISKRIRDALVTCNVGMALITADFVKKRWPLLELFILSARSIHDENEFKLAVVTLCSTAEDNLYRSRGWNSWFDCFKALPLPWPGDRVAIKLIDDCSGNVVRRLSDELASTVKDVEAKKKAKRERQLLSLFVPLLVLSLVLALLSNLGVISDSNSIPFLKLQGNSSHPPSAYTSIKPPNLFVGSFHVPEPLPYFQGRLKEMDKLTQMLNATSSATVVPFGLGGVGKTQLVVSWVNKNKDQYGAIVWLRAEQELALINDLVSYSYATGFSSPLDPEISAEKIARRVVRAIEAQSENRPHILLVYDNAESFDAVEKWMPTFGSSCHTIITTRDSGGMDEDSLLKLGPLDPDSSIRIVEYFVKRTIKDEERTMVLKVFRTFDYLPLAMVAFSTQARELGIFEAVREFEERREEAFNERLKLGRNFRGYNRESLYAVLRMQLDSLSTEATIALEYLSVVDAERVPVWLLEPLMQSSDFDGALEYLQDKAIIQFNTRLQLISTHRLLQDSAWDEMSEQRRMTVLNDTGLAVLRSMDSVDLSAGRNETFISVTPHALAIVHRPWPVESELLASLFFNLGKANNYAGDYKESLAQLIEAEHILKASLGDNNLERAMTLNEMGTAYENQALHDKALKLYEQALSILKSSLGDKHPYVGITLNGMAIVYDHQGLYDKALEVHEQAFSIYKASLGDRNPEVATTLNSMAMVYYNQGLYDKALELYKQALSIRKVSLGDTHPRVATTLNNMALVYCDQGLYDKALELYKQVLSIRKASLGDKHPHVATTLSNIASVYVNQGFYDKALELYEQDLSIGKATLGDNHPDVASTLNNMASVYKNHGLYDKALELYEQALSIYKASLGDDHQLVATTLNNMASVYDDQGLYDKALEFYKQALSIQKTSLGDNHPNVATTLNNMALLYHNQGLYDKALEMYGEALSIRKSSLGDNHPNVASTLNNMAMVYGHQGMHDKALELYEQALSIFKASLGNNHQLVATTLNNMASVYEDQGLYDKALEFYEQALSIQKTSLGENHPIVATTLNNIAYVYRDQGLYEKALEFFQQALSIEKASLGDNHPQVGTILNNMAGVYYNQGLYGKALELYEQVLTIRKASFGDHHPFVVAVLQDIHTIKELVRDEK